MLNLLQCMNDTALTDSILWNTKCHCEIRGWSITKYKIRASNIEKAQSSGGTRWDGVGLLDNRQHTLPLYLIYTRAILFLASPHPAIPNGKWIKDVLDPPPHVLITFLPFFLFSSCWFILGIWNETILYYSENKIGFNASFIDRKTLQITPLTALRQSGPSCSIYFHGKTIYLFIWVKQLHLIDGLWPPS